MKYLITHNSTFHADDVSAYAILNHLFPNAELIRTRDAKLFAPSDDSIVFDLGAQADHSIRTYDHHQRNGAGMRESGVKFAALGLVWLYYGHRFIQALLEQEHGDISSAIIAEIWETLDAGLISYLDAFDNGQLHQESGCLREYPELDLPAPTLPLVVNAFNRFENLMSSEQDAAFVAASKVVFTVFSSAVFQSFAKMEAEKYFEDHYEDGQEIMVLEKMMPWRGPASKRKSLQFVVYFDNSLYRVMQVPVREDSFEGRTSLPEQWRGLRGDDLVKASGIKTVTFCHPTGFTGGALTLEDAYRMAKIAVEMSKPHALAV